MKYRLSRQTLVGLFLALVPASGVQAQNVGPRYIVPPSIDYGQLFPDVQLRAIFPDGKTFPDLIPHGTPQSLVRNYVMARQRPISISRASSASTSPAPYRPVPR
jgi:neutral trehalase